MSSVSQPSKSLPGRISNRLFSLQFPTPLPGRQLLHQQFQFFSLFAWTYTPSVLMLDTITEIFIIVCEVPEVCVWEDIAIILKKEVKKAKNHFITINVELLGISFCV